MPGKQLTIKTNRGEIKLELFADKTPVTVQKFEALAKKGFYNGLKFHRVIANFMIQTGCPKGIGTGDAGYKFDCEIVPALKHAKGVISMAHAGTCRHDKATGKKIQGDCSNGSQFFITHVPTAHLDGVHTVFGKVTSGQDVVDAVKQGDVMEAVTVSDTP